MHVNHCQFEFLELNAIITLYFRELFYFDIFVKLWVKRTPCP